MLANILFPNVKETPEDMEKRYPQRDLPKGAPVTRIGPSPTGFVHLGNLYNATIAERLAHQHQGVFFLRIEDTDNKREVPGAVNTVISAMKYFGIIFDEGAIMDGDKGDYGPYRQRQRANIYHIYAKLLVEKGLAYPCFCSEEELAEIHDKQKERKTDYGYYGEWARCRNLSLDEIRRKIEDGKKYVLRFRANPNNNESICVTDKIRGELKMPGNKLDFVILKSDGIPTYHFAHVVDDHLMRTTHVIRGEEWISSLPIHVQLFEALGWDMPIYCHTATLMKIDGTSKRKLSKRKDPELSLEYYQKEGFLPEVIWNYMLTILNSNYEEWHIKNPEKSYEEFGFKLDKMSNSGALFDLDKLYNLSKDIISEYSAEFLYDKWLSWANVWNREYADILVKNKTLAIEALSIGRNAKKKRKDIVTMKQACDFMSMFFDETFEISDERTDQIENVKVKEFLTDYIHDVVGLQDKTQWFDKVKELTELIDCASNMKDYKNNPDKYVGNIVDVTNILRLAILGRINAPDIWDASCILGIDRVKGRINKFIKEELDED